MTKSKAPKVLISCLDVYEKKLTLHPDTIAGKELLAISRELLHVDDNAQKEKWLSSFKTWMYQYKDFVSEKTINEETGEIWFTHKELRSAAWN